MAMSRAKNVFIIKRKELVGMNMFATIIRQGLVVLEHELKQMDIGIQDGVITMIAPNIEASAKQEIDATGKYVFPGVVDSHVHFSDPGRAEWEGFVTGSQMMAAGGVTTFIDMPLNGIPSTVTAQYVHDKAQRGLTSSYVDFALWGGLVPGNIGELEGMAKAGVIGFKAFISPSGNEEFEHVDAETLLSGMQEIARLGKVLALHAESAEITTWLTKEKQARQQTTADDYAATRPVEAEVEAVERALQYAAITGCPLHFVHISSAEAVSAIQRAKEKGQDVTLETCPHYLLYSHEALVEKGAVAKCAPPLRAPQQVAALRQCLADGSIDFLASDHSPAPSTLKQGDNFFDMWGGISGGQYTLQAAIELALTLQLPMTDVARWTAQAPAERFGLLQKGKTAVGYDADIVIVEMSSFTATQHNFFAKHKESLYMGHRFPCTISTTLVRGAVVYTNGQVHHEQPNWQRPRVPQFEF